MRRSRSNRCARRATANTAARAFVGINLDRLKREGPIRLNLPKNYAPFANGNFGTLSGKCELYSESLGKRGLDPLPNYTPPHEDPRTRQDLAAKYPLQLLSPPAPEFLNSTFRQHRFAAPKKQASPTLEIHPLDAAPRGIINGQWLRIFNDRGSFQARAIVAETVKAGRRGLAEYLVEPLFPRRRQLQYDDEHRADRFRRGATFFDNLVQVERI